MTYLKLKTKFTQTASYQSNNFYMVLKWAALDDFDELLSFHVLKWHEVLREISRESFTKFHTVSPSFNEGGKMIKIVYIWVLFISKAEWTQS